jgi:hypothetical protein
LVFSDYFCLKIFFLLFSLKPKEKAKRKSVDQQTVDTATTKKSKKLNQLISEQLDACQSAQSSYHQNNNNNINISNNNNNNNSLIVQNTTTEKNVSLQASLNSQIFLRSSHLSGSIPLVTLHHQNLHNSASIMHPISIQFMNGIGNSSTATANLTLNGNDANFF